LVVAVELVLLKVNNLELKDLTQVLFLSHGNGVHQLLQLEEEVEAVGLNLALPLQAVQGGQVEVVVAASAKVEKLFTQEALILMHQDKVILGVPLRQLELVAAVAVQVVDQPAKQHQSKMDLTAHILQLMDQILHMRGAAQAELDYSLQ
jgi:hypothetical protein